MHSHPSRNAKPLLSQPFIQRTSVIALGLMLLCACDPHASSRRPRRPTRDRCQRGEASYYSDKLAGRPTASGQPYRPGHFTAAHRHLGFGTRVRVFARNGKSVDVTINDRGPFVKGRIIDLSKAEAKRLEMVRAGHVPVKICMLAIE